MLCDKTDLAHSVYYLNYLSTPLPPPSPRPEPKPQIGMPIQPPKLIRNFQPRVPLALGKRLTYLKTRLMAPLLDSAVSESKYLITSAISPAMVSVSPEFIMVTPLGAMATGAQLAFLPLPTRRRVAPSWCRGQAYDFGSRWRARPFVGS
jgi:hypothetical protein